VPRKKASSVRAVPTRVGGKPPRDVGQETLLKFKYQIEYVILRWLQLVEDRLSYLLCEIDEDLQVLTATLGAERIQVKTLDRGNWTAGRLTSKNSPVVQRFVGQARDDDKLTFRFVTNAPGAPTFFEDLPNTVLKHTDLSGDGVTAFLARVTFDFGYVGLNDIELRVREEIRRVAESVFDVRPAQDHVLRLHERLFEAAFVASSSPSKQERRLDAERLRSIFQSSLNSIEVGPGVDLAVAGRAVNQLLERVSGSGALGLDATSLVQAFEDRITTLKSALLNQFQARLEEQIANVKQRHLFQTARAGLESLVEEADSNSEIRESPDLMYKLFTNLTVCTERQGDMEAAVHYAEKAAAVRAIDARSITNLAVAKMKRGDQLDAALISVDEALRFNPDYRPAHVVRLTLVAELESATVALEEAAKLPWAKSDASAQYAISSIHLLNGSIHEATTAARRAVALDRSPEHLSWLAHMLIDANEPRVEKLEFKVRGLPRASGDLEEGLALFREAAQQFAVEQRVGRADMVQIDVGRTLLSLERDDEAILQFEALLSSTTEDVARTAYSNLIEAHLPRQTATAVKLAEQANAAFPDDPYLLFAWNRALLTSGQPREALTALNRLVSVANAPESLRRYAQCFIATAHIELGEFEAAEDALDLVDPGEHAYGIIAKARVLLGQEAGSAARQWALDSAANHSDEPGVVKVCADFLRNHGFDDDAAVLYRRIVATVTDDTQLTGERYTTFVTMAYFAKDWKRCLTIEPTRAPDSDAAYEMHIIKAHAHEEFNLYEDALREYQEIAAPYAERRDVIDGLVRCAFALARPSVAISRVANYIRNGNGGAIEMINLASLYALAGDTEASIANARAALQLAPDDRRVSEIYIVVMIRNGRVDDAVIQMHKYLEAFPGTKMVQVWRGEPDTVAQRLFDKVLLPRMKQHERVGALYAQHPIPLGLMAKALGRSYVSLWHGIMDSELNGAFATTRGEDVARTSQTLSSREAVIDLSAVLTLGMLDLLGILAGTLDTIYVAGSVIDEIRDELFHTDEPLLRRVLTTFERDPDTFRVVAVDERRSRVFPAKVKRRLGRQEVDSARLADRQSVPMICDDLAMRELSKAHGIEGLSSRALLEFLFTQGAIDAETYSKSVVALVEHNYQFISYSALVLDWAVRNKKDGAKSLVSQIDLAGAELTSYAGVFAETLAGLWASPKQKLNDTSVSVWTDEILATLLMKGGAKLALPAVATVSMSILRVKPPAMSPFLFAVFAMFRNRRFSDEVLLILLFGTAIHLAGAVKQGAIKREAVSHFFNALGHHWAARLKRLLRDGGTEAYSLLFDETK